MRFSTRIAALAASVVALVMVATPALAARSHATVKAITVTASEFKFKLSSSTASHGTVTFTIVNKGKIPHDFKIAGKTSKMVAPGKSTKLIVTLKAGKFAYICTVAGHAKLGMKGTLTVK